MTDIIMYKPDNSNRKGIWMLKRVPYRNSFSPEYTCILCKSTQVEPFDTCPNCKAKMVDDYEYF